MFGLSVYTDLYLGDLLQLWFSRALAGQQSLSAPFLNNQRGLLEEDCAARA